MKYKNCLVVISFLLGILSCEQKSNSYGSVSLAEEYVPICFRDFTPSADPICSEGYVLNIDYQNDIDYCCEGGTSLPGGGGGGNFSAKGICLPVGTDFCPPNYALTPGVVGSDCTLTGCAAAGYDTHPVTGECSCACLETFTPGEEQTTPPTCPDVPGLVWVGYHIDDGGGLPDTCHYRDVEPTATEIIALPPTCTNGTLQIQEEQDLCFLEYLCPEGTIPQPDGTCGLCSFPCESTNHSIRSANPVHVLFVLDRSGSMTDGFAGGQSRWNAGIQAIENIMNAGGPIDFGLQLYSIDDVCGADDIIVPIGPQTSIAIVQAMATTFPSGDNPIAAALTTAYSQGFTNTPQGTNKVVILVGDGDEAAQCADPSESIALATNAFAQSNIRTFALSLNATDVSANEYLTTLAQAGGTAGVMIPSTMEEIATTVLDTLPSCSFALTETQALNTSDISVVIDGEVIPENDWHLLGDHVIVEHPWCDAITSGTVQSVNVTANCSE